MSGNVKYADDIVLLSETQQELKKYIAKCKAVRGNAGESKQD